MVCSQHVRPKFDSDIGRLHAVHAKQTLGWTIKEMEAWVSVVALVSIQGCQKNLKICKYSQRDCRLSDCSGFLNMTSLHAYIMLHTHTPCGEDVKPISACIECTLACDLVHPFKEGRQVL